MNARRGIAVIATLLVASVMLLVSLPAEIPPATAARPYALQSSYPRVVATINVGAHPWFDDWNPVRDMWFVANEGAGTVPAIYAQTGVLAATITVGSAPKGVENVSVASTGQNEVWVTNSGSGTVSVINATTLTVAHTIGIGTNAERLCYDSGNRTVFVMNRGSNNISVIGTGNYTDWGSIPTGSQPIGCYFDDDTSTLFVADYAANIVQAFNGSTFALIANITGFNGPTVIAHDFSPYHEIFVSDWGSGEVSVVNDRSHIIVANITVGTNPYGIGFDAQTAQAFVTNSGGNTVSIISAERNLVTSTIPVGTTPYGAHAYDPLDGLFLSVNYGSNNVSVISDGTGGSRNQSASGGGGGYFNPNPKQPTNNSTVSNTTPFWVGPVPAIVGVLVLGVGVVLAAFRRFVLGPVLIVTGIAILYLAFGPPATPPWPWGSG